MFYEEDNALYTFVRPPQGTFKQPDFPYRLRRNESDCLRFIIASAREQFPICTWRMIVVSGPFLSSRSGVGMPLWGLRLSSSTASLTTPQNQSVTRVGEK